MDLKEMGWEGVDWIHLAQDKVQWRAVVNTVMSLYLLIYLLTYSLRGAVYYLKSLLSLSLSKISCLLHGTCHWTLS
jgi:hypothetical protein